jgi:membrane protein YqaA with SNARE-associated domain
MASAALPQAARVRIAIARGLPRRYTRPDTDGKGARGMLQALYERTMALATHRHALWALGGVAFVESSVFPIPPDALLIPMILAARERALVVAAVCTGASVLGGLAGYGIGYFLFEAVGRPILDFYGQEQTFAEFAEAYNRWGAWIVAGAGLTPFPYKVVTIASGATGLSLATFMVASVASRGLRFFLEAALLWYVGPPVRRFVERNLKWAATLFFLALLGGFALVRYLL